MSNGLPTITPGPMYGFSFPELPNLSFAGEGAPAQAGPEWSQAHLYNEGASYNGPAGAVHIGNIWGILDLPLLPGVWTVSDFIRGPFVDVMNKMLQLQGVATLAIMVYEYRQPASNAWTPDTLGYEFEIIAKSSGQAEVVWDQRWSANEMLRQRDAQLGVWDKRWSASELAVAQPDFSLNNLSLGDIAGAAVIVLGLIIAGTATAPIAIPALVFAGLAALALSPGVREGFSSIFTSTARTAVGAITGDPNKGLIPAIGNVLTMPILVTGGVVAGLVTLLFVAEQKTGVKPDYAKLKGATDMFGAVADTANKIPLAQANTIRAVREAVK